MALYDLRLSDAQLKARSVPNGNRRGRKTGRFVPLRTGKLLRQVPLLSNGTRYRAVHRCEGCHVEMVKFSSSCWRGPAWDTACLIETLALVIGLVVVVHAPLSHAAEPKLNVPSGPAVVPLLGNSGGRLTIDFSTSTQKLTINGDSKNNILTVSRGGSVLVLECGGGTQLKLTVDGVAGALVTTATINNVSGNTTISGDLGSGDDSLTIVAMPIDTLNPNLGDGNDKLTLAYSTVARSAVDGGAGNNTFISTSSTIINNRNKNFP